MRPCTRQAVALAIGATWAIVAVLARVQMEPSARTRLAMPAAPEETVYRPECPANHSSKAVLSCPLAGPDG